MTAHGYIPPVDDAERLFVRRVKELAGAAERSGAPRQTAFLSDRQQALATAALSAVGCTAYHFDGGYPEAERKILCLHGDAGEKAAPQFVCLQIEAIGDCRALTHRDYLGAILALGVKRECVGDLVLCDTGAYGFFLQSVAPLVQEELMQVGSRPVHICEAQAQQLPGPQQRPLRQVSIASLRLDALLAAMLHTSRADAADLIKSGAVEINHVPTASVHAEIFAGDTFSVRRHGKYHLSEIGAQSRKGRVFVSYFEY